MQGCPEALSLPEAGNQTLVSELLGMSQRHILGDPPSGRGHSWGPLGRQPGGFPNGKGVTCLHVGLLVAVINHERRARIPVDIKNHEAGERLGMSLGQHEWWWGH